MTDLDQLHIQTQEIAFEVLDGAELADRENLVNQCNGCGLYYTVGYDGDSVHCVFCRPS